MNDFLKNICLITFALVGPITLPAGGIHRNVNQIKVLNNSKEIILSSDCSLYTCPTINAKELLVINTGTSLSVLRKWHLTEKNSWARVELATNKLIDSPKKTTKGWIRI